MDMRSIEEMADAALIERIIEAECMECGISIQCEPDARTAWCDNCDKIVKVRNFIRLMQSGWRSSLQGVRRFGRQQPSGMQPQKSKGYSPVGVLSRRRQCRIMYPVS